MNVTKGMQHIDARGLHCPLPILKTKKALRAMATGDRIEVLATDPASVRDFDDFTRKHGHLLLDQSRSTKLFRFLIQKGESLKPADATDWS